MLIIAGSEKGESPSRTLAINLSPLHPWKNRERGSRVKAIGWCLWRDTSDRFTQTPFSEFLPSHTLLYFPYDITSRASYFYSFSFESPSFSGALKSKKKS